MTNGKAIRLYFRLNADAMNYTPLSHRGRRAARLMPMILAKYDLRNKEGAR
jgi:hypothetical protein